MNRRSALSLILLLGTILGLGAQEAVRIRISEGIPLIPVALPNFLQKDLSPEQKPLADEVYDTLWQDLTYSRVFKLIPREQYGYVASIDPAQIRFKDWASLQANILIVGEISFPGPDRMVFAFKVYDTQAERLIFGRNFGGKTDHLRLIAHRAADEMMKHFGEVPFFTSKIVYVSERDGNREIYMMDYDGQRERRITANDYLDILPTWSGDNERIVYTSYRKGAPDLYAFNIYTGKTEIISTGGTNWGADWSAQGDQLAYTSTKGGLAQIYVRDMQTGKERQLTFNRIIDTSPCFSPSGKQIVFTSERMGTPQIYIMGADGTNVRRLTFEGNYHDSPAWSPDGERIAYVSRIEGRFDIYVYNLSSNSISKLTENAGRNENPSWSPDGRHLVFASNRQGTYQLYTVDYDGANLKKLTSKGGNLTPDWQKR
jgi:TolB protein